MNSEFRDYYFRIPWSRRCVFRKKVCELVGWREQKFYDILSRQEMKKAEKEIIKQLIEN